MHNSYQTIILTDSFMYGTTKPLGAYSIANVLRMNGYTSLVIDNISAFEPEKLFSILKGAVSSDTLFVGYSSSLFQGIDGYRGKTRPNGVLTIEFSLFEQINKFVKTINPSTKIVYGGSGAKNMTMQVASSKTTYDIDYFFFGNSEKMVVDFANDLKNNKQPTSPNSVRVQCTTDHAVDIPVIDYDIKGELFDFKNSKHTWEEHDIILPGEALPLEVARGCIFKCKFCAFPLVGKNINDDSYIRAEKVLLEEVQFNYEKFNTTKYVIMDDTFNERTDKIEMLLRVRDKSKLDLSFVGYNRVDLIARIPEQISLLKDLNFNGMFFGIESMNYEAAKAIGKGCRPEEITETLYKLKDAFNNRLLISAGFIIGLPHDTPETVEAWANLVIKEDYPIDAPHFFPLGIMNTGYSKSIFFEERKKYNLNVVPNDWPLKWQNTTWNYDQCAQLSRDYNQLAKQSSKNRLGIFQAQGCSKYGITWDEILTTHNNEMHSIIIPKHNNYLVKYQEELEKNVFNK